MKSFRGLWLPCFAQAALLLVASMASPTAFAQVPAAEPAAVLKPYWMTADNDRLMRLRATEARLNNKVSFDFIDIPFMDAVRQLGKDAGVTVTINAAELDTLGLDVNQPITASNQAVTLREALEQILRPMDLAIYINEADIEVSSVDDVSERLVIRVYDLAHFVKSEAQVSELMFKISQIVDPDEWRDFGGTGNSVLMPFGSALVIAAPASTHRGVVKVLSSLARSPDSLPAAPADNSWKTGKAFSITGNAARQPELESGSIALPEGANYELVRIVQQPSAQSNAEHDKTWVKPETPAPEWLATEESASAEGDTIRLKLRQTIDVSFDGLPLDVAMAQIFKKLEANYWLNGAELDTLGVTVDTPISLHLEKQSASAVLDRIFRPLDLHYRITANSVEITSVDQANESPQTRFYDMSVLSPKPFDMRALLMMIASTVTPDQWRDWGGTGDSVLTSFGPKLCVTAPEATFNELDGLLCQLARLHPANLPQPVPQQNIKFETVISGIPGSSTIKLPTDGMYQFRMTK